MGKISSPTLAGDNLEREGGRGMGSWLTPIVGTSLRNLDPEQGETFGIKSLLSLYVRE